MIPYLGVFVFNFRGGYLLSIISYRLENLKNVDMNRDALKCRFEVELHRMCTAMDRPYFDLSLL